MIFCILLIHAYLCLKYITLIEYHLNFRTINIYVIIYWHFFPKLCHRRCSNATKGNISMVRRTHPRASFWSWHRRGTVDSAPVYVKYQGTVVYNPYRTNGTFQVLIVHLLLIIKGKVDENISLKRK